MPSTTIQTQVSNYATARPRTCIDSLGRIFALYRYTSAGTSYLAMAYSSDAGTTWTQVTEVDSTTKNGFAMVIDSTNVIHVAYMKSSYVVVYRTFSNLAWNAEETIFDGTANTDDFDSIDIAVDSNDIPHVAWAQFAPATTVRAVYYSNRTGGSWAARTQLNDATGVSNIAEPKMVINSLDHIYVFWRLITTGSSALVRYARYTTFWTADATLRTISSNGTTQLKPHAVVDSSNDIHIVWFTQVAGEIEYIKYTKSTDTFGSVTVIETTLTNNDITGVPSIGVDADDDLTVIWTNSADIKYLTSVDNGGTWSGVAALVTGTGPTYSMFSNVYFPIVQGVNTQIPSSGLHFMFIEAAGPTLKYYHDSGLTLQAPVTKNYSRGDLAALPTNDSGLETLFTLSGYSNVASDDDVYEDQTATAQYSIFEFKDYSGSSTAEIHVTWKGKSNVSSTASSTFLQIYNQVDSAWQTLDTDTVTGVNTEFTLVGDITDSLADYYTAANFVSCRVYQLAP